MPAALWTLFAGFLACAAGEGVATRPDPEGKATRVTAAVYVIDVAEVDDSRRTFTADLYVLFRWKDARLASPSGRRRLPLAEVWHPPLLVLNQRSVARLLPETAEVDGQGEVEYRQRFQGTFSVHLDLRGFPLDRQALAVRLITPGLSPAQLEIVPAEQAARSAAFSILDWVVGPPSCRAETLAAPDGGGIAGLRCELPASRLAIAYFYQFVIPLAFIVSMSWAAFWMAPEQLPPRQSIAVTSMLTIIAYRFVLANQLPKVAYLTRFDYLLLGCTALVFLALVQVVAVHRLLTHGDAEGARALDRRARFTFPALFVALLAAVILL